MESREHAEAGPVTAFVIKTAVHDPGADRFSFAAQKTMYGGKRIAAGDRIYIFASENEGGDGLIARGIVRSAVALPKPAGAERHTPRVNITVELTAPAIRRLGRRELKAFDGWGDGRPETELNFKFYRQATDKIGGISPEAAAFLDGFFQKPGSG